MLDKQLRNVVLFVERSRHQRLINLVESAICQGDSGCCARWLTCEASLAEEFPGAQNGDDCFLSLFGNSREFHPASPEVEQGIRRLSLLEDVAALPAGYRGFPVEDCSKQGLPRDRPAFAICHVNLRKIPRASVSHQIRIAAQNTVYILLVQSACLFDVAHVSGQICSFPSIEGLVDIIEDSKSILFVQDYAEEATMDRQSTIVVIDEAKLPELVHEMTDARSRCSDHLRQGILIYSGDHGLGSAFFAKLSKH